MRYRVVALLLAGALAVVAAGACGGDDDVAGQDQTRSTTTAPPASTTSTTVDPATLDTSGDDFDRIVRNMIEIRRAAYRVPQPALLDVIYDAACYCHAAERREIEALVGSRERYVGPSTEVLEVKVMERPSPEEAVLHVVSKHGPQIVRSSDGSERRVGDGWPPTTHLFKLRVAESRWRVFSITEVKPQ